MLDGVRSADKTEMNWHRAITYLLLSALAICALPSRAAAECAPRPVEACALVNNDSEIFIARVLPQSGNGLDWQMRVIRSFRGTARGTIVVTVWSQGDLPSPARLEPGKDYLFYVSKTVEQGSTVRSTALACGIWLPLGLVSRSELDFLARLGDSMTDGRVTGSLGRRVGLIDRQPLAGIQISLHSERGVVSAVTDQRGFFEIGGLAPGNYDVSTTVPANLLVKLLGPVWLAPHGCTEAYLVAEPNTIISGRVTLPSGFVVANTEVAAFDSAGRVVTNTYVDDSGRYVLAGLDPGEYIVGLAMLGLPPGAEKPFLQTFAPGTTERETATRIRIDGPGIHANVDIAVVAAQEIATITINAHTADGRPVAEARMDVSLDGYGTRGVGKTDASGVAQLNLVKGVRVFLLGGGAGGCMVPLELGPTNYPAALDLMFTPDGCRQTDNLSHRASLAVQARDGLTTRRIQVVYPDGRPASDVHVGITSRPQRPPLVSAFRTASDGSLEMPIPLKTEFYIHASRFGSGGACQSDYVWFNTERDDVRWQQRAKWGDLPDWNDGTASTGDVVLRLMGENCAPSR